MSTDTRGSERAVEAPGPKKREVGGVVASIATTESVALEVSVKPRSNSTPPMVGAFVTTKSTEKSTAPPPTLMSMQVSIVPTKLAVLVPPEKGLTSIDTVGAGSWALTSSPPAKRAAATSTATAKSRVIPILLAMSTLPLLARYPSASHLEAGSVASPPGSSGDTLFYNG